MAERLSLAELEVFDQHPYKCGDITRFCCPLCHGSRTMDSSHRSLALDTNTGAWKCHRCGRTGLILEKWSDNPQDIRKQKRQASIKKNFGLSSAGSKPLDPAKVDNLNKRLKEGNLKPIKGSPGEAYLSGRGIPVDLAVDTRCKYSQNWYGDPAVVFPFLGVAGELVSAQGRFIGNRKPKTLDAGNKDHGVFITPGALDGEWLVVTEAPIDALTLALAGLPTVALGGLNCPEWLSKIAANKTLLIATDADESGEEKTAKLKTEIGAYCGKCYRLRPSRKDWNEVLTKDGLEVLIDLLNEALPVTFDIEELAAVTEAPPGPVEAVPLAEHEPDPVYLATLVESLQSKILESLQGHDLPIRISRAEVITDIDLYAFAAARQALHRSPEVSRAAKDQLNTLGIKCKEMMD